MKNSFIILIASICIGFTSCVSTKVKVNTIYQYGLPIDTLNLVSTMIGPVMQPVLPLIDAAAFNEKTNKIADQILDVEQQKIESFKSILLDNLSEKLPATIVTGSEFTTSNASKYKVGNSLGIENNNFPVVFFSEGDMNMIDFGKGKNVNEIFRNNEEIKKQISAFATALNLQTVLLSYNRLSVIGVGMFGTSGNLRMETYLFLYKADGELLMDVSGFTKPTNISGSNLSGYEIQLDNFQVLAEMMSTELIKYIK